MTFIRCPAMLQCLRTLPAVGFIILASWSVLPASAAGQKNTSVIGKWKLTAVLDSSEITSIDDEEAQQFVGKVLRISRDKVQLGTRVCEAPAFDVTRAETYKYFRDEAHASAEKLGLPNPVTAVHVSCTSVYIKTADRLVVHWKGYFFDAVRQGNSTKL